MVKKVFRELTKKCYPQFLLSSRLSRFFALKICISIDILMADSKNALFPPRRVRAGERKNMYDFAVTTSLIIVSFMLIVVFASSFVRYDSPYRNIMNTILTSCCIVVFALCVCAIYDLARESLSPSPAPIYQVETGIDGETSNARLGIKNLIPIDERDEKDIHGTDTLYYDLETGIVYFGDKYSPSAYYSPNGKLYKYDPDKKLFSEIN